MTRSGWALTGLGVAVAAIAAKRSKRVKRALGAYVQEIESGARPIQAVGTAVAAFVGLGPGSP